MVNMSCTNYMVMQLPTDYSLLCTSLSYFYHTKCSNNYYDDINVNRAEKSTKNVLGSSCNIKSILGRIYD
jgi:hypothetical protein